MIGLGLLYVGAVLVINGIWLLGGVAPRGAAVMNAFTGLLTFIIAVYTALAQPLGQQSFFAAAQVLLFSFTYLWVAINNFLNVEDGRGLGWYCLFVAALTLPTSYLTFQANDPRFGVIWLVWGALWFLFFLTLALRVSLQRFTGWSTVAVGILTAAVPGYLILINKW